jgi:hypothetical protein
MPEEGCLPLLHPYPCPPPSEAVSQSLESLFSVISTEGRNLEFRPLEESRFLGCRLEMTLRHSLSRGRIFGVACESALITRTSHLGRELLL